MVTSEEKRRIGIPRKFKPFLNKHRYKIAYGGRGSAKSWTIATILVSMAYQEPLRILCARELQLSISESVHRLICDCIDRLGLSPYFTIEKATIYCQNGSQFLFSGIKSNVTKIKSTEGIDICWIEEAEAVSEESWNILIPTIRKEGSEIWISFNPCNILDATYQRFVTNPPSDAYVTKVNYHDNPWFPDVLRLEMEEMRENDFYMYRHVWLGEPVADSDMAIIKPAWIESARDAHLKLQIEPSGGRFAGFDVADQGPDANALIWRHSVIIQGIEEWKDIDPGNAAQYAHGVCIENKIELLHYDNIGVGAGAKSEFRQEQSRMLENNRGFQRVRTEGFNAGSAVINPESDYMPGKKNKDHFYNVKAQMWQLVADRFRHTHNAINGKPFNSDKLICIPNNLQFVDKLCAELSQPRREYVNGKLKVESKDDMKKRGVKSPNLADALILCFIDGVGFDLSALL